MIPSGEPDGRCTTERRLGGEAFASGKSATSLIWGEIPRGRSFLFAGAVSALYDLVGQIVAGVVGIECLLLMRRLLLRFSEVLNRFEPDE